MPAKRLLFKSAARDKVIKGATALADTVIENGVPGAEFRHSVLRTSRDY